MEIKEKPCKGTGKAKDFGCGNPTLVRVYGLCKQCKINWMLETENGAEYLAKMTLKGKKEYEKKAHLERKKEKESLVDWSKKLQAKFNAIIRLIDAGLPCLAKNYHANQIHAGHVYARGGNNTIRLNAHNVHRQSAQSNHFQNDDGLLREGVVREYGQEYMDFISDLRRTPSLNYMPHEYKAFFDRASEIYLNIKNNGLTFKTPEDRIKMRNYLNNELGIYDQEFCEFKIK